MKSTEKPDPIRIGSRHQSHDGYCVIANDTSTHRPWCWKFPDLKMAKLLAKTLCEELDQEVLICKEIGIMRRKRPETEFEEAKAL